VLFDDDESVDDTDVVDDIDDPFAQLDEDAPDSRSAADASRAGANDPFDELGPATGETDAALDEAFERMDVGDLTEEDIWKSLDEDAEGGFGSVGEFGGRGFGDEHDRVRSRRGGRRRRKIRRRRRRARNLEADVLPAVSTLLGTAGSRLWSRGNDYRRVGRVRRVRVRNCPMVDDDDPTFDATRGE